MFLSAEEIASSRLQSASHALALAAACMQAGHRLHELFSAASRDAVQHGTRQMAHFGHGQFESLSQLPAILWLESSVRHSRLVDDACSIFGEAHKALIESAEAQVRIIDDAIFAGLRRASRLSPCEVAVTLQAWRTATESSEQTLPGVSEAASETIDLAEREVHQISAPLPPRQPASRSRQRKQQTT